MVLSDLWIFFNFSGIFIESLLYNNSQHEALANQLNANVSEYQAQIYVLKRERTYSSCHLH